MGYRRMNKRDLWEIYRRWRAGQPLSHIAEAEGRDRKTVREYIASLHELGLGADGAVDQQQFYRRVERLLPGRSDRPAPARVQLARHREEIRELINREKEPLKPKTAFLVVKRKYLLDVSYETFKRYARREGLSRAAARPMIRIELPPGLETQLDYCKVGTLSEPVTGKNRVVWAFCGVLAHSRLPFVQFVRTQDQVSFVGSVVSMFEYYDGVSEFISIDNLKSGVIKPDLWDPQINRALAEAAEHYGVFVDPCRIGRATDKAKVERLVPVVRELFRMLKALHPQIGLVELNKRALLWCRQEYGRREHGTTGIPPMEAFAQEKSSLKDLPLERFRVPVWRQVSVHSGDQFLTFNKMRFSLPPAWRGRKVWARYASPMLQLFSDEKLIRQYVVEHGRRRYWKPEDFPAEVREMMNGGYPGWILGKSHSYGSAAAALIASVLEGHAYLNARRARGMLSLMAEHHSQPYFDEVCLRARNNAVRLPSTLRRMLETAQSRPLLQQELPISEVGAQMVRDVRYYLN